MIRIGSYIWTNGTPTVEQPKHQRHRKYEQKPLKYEQSTGEFNRQVHLNITHASLLIASSVK